MGDERDGGPPLGVGASEHVIYIELCISVMYIM